jgi:GT2 family glycosyltransferase
VRVSFIIPLYNCLPLTQAMLASLQATIPTNLEHEIILVDDGSTDGTREWLATLDSRTIKILLNEQNLGYAGANNRAAATATGEVLVLLNNDLVLTPGWLEPMLALHQAIPKPGTIGNVQVNASTGAVDHAGIFVTVKGKPEHDVCLPRKADHKLSPAVTGACLLITRLLWQELGGFAPQFMNGGEDIDLGFRAARAGYTNAVALHSVIYHHISASPGRGQHDERNSYFLTLRWKDELIGLGAHAWCKHHVRHTPYLKLFSLPTILLYLAGLRRTAPAAALRGVEKNIDHSLGIWTKLFGAGPASHS